MNNTILVGNGFTRSKSNISWNDLMDSLSKKYGGFELDEEIAFPLEFERMVNTYLENAELRDSTIYDQIKSDVVALFRTLPLDKGDIQYDLLDLNVQSIMTTNYDTLLENAFAAHPISIKDTKYLLQRCYETEKVAFYHPHGIVDKPGTICLGYEHYMGLVNSIYKNKKSIEKVLNGEKVKDDDEWQYKFFTDNMSIIGLGLSLQEYDIWWLLTLRASLYYTANKDLRDKINNRIVYYDAVEDKDRIKKNRIHKSLRGMNVEVVSFDIGKDVADYLEAYHKSIENMKVSLFV